MGLWSKKEKATPPPATPLALTTPQGGQVGHDATGVSKGAKKALDNAETYEDMAHRGYGESSVEAGVFMLDRFGLPSQDIVGPRIHASQPSTLQSVVDQFARLPLEKVHHYAMNGEFAHSLLKDRRLVDILVHISGRTFFAHRIILCNHSKMLASLLYNLDIGPHMVTDVSLTSVDPEYFKMFIYFAYTGDIYFSSDNINPWIMFSRALEADPLQARIQIYLSSIDPMPLDQALATILSDKDSEDFMKPLAEMVLLDQFQSVLDGSDDLYKLSLKDFQDVLRSSVLCVKAEVEVFWAVLLWVASDLEGRRGMLDELMASVRFTCMSSLELMDCARASELVKLSDKCREMLVTANWVCHARETGLEDPLGLPEHSKRACLQHMDPYQPTVADFDLKFLRYQKLLTQNSSLQAKPDETEEPTASKSVQFKDTYETNLESSNHNDLDDDGSGIFFKDAISKYEETAILEKKRSRTPSTKRLTVIDNYITDKAMIRISSDSINETTVLPTGTLSINPDHSLMIKSSHTIPNKSSFITPTKSSDIIQNKSSFITTNKSSYSAPNKSSSVKPNTSKSRDARRSLTRSSRLLDGNSNDDNINPVLPRSKTSLYQGTFPLEESPHSIQLYTSSETLLNELDNNINPVLPRSKRSLYQETFNSEDSPNSTHSIQMYTDNAKDSNNTTLLQSKTSLYEETVHHVDSPPSRHSIKMYTAASESGPSETKFISMDDETFNSKPTSNTSTESSKSSGDKNQTTNARKTLTNSKKENPLRDQKQLQSYDKKQRSRKTHPSYQKRLKATQCIDAKGRKELTTTNSSCELLCLNPFYGGKVSEADLKLLDENNGCIEDRFVSTETIHTKSLSPIKFSVKKSERMKQSQNAFKSTSPKKQTLANTSNSNSTNQTQQTLDPFYRTDIQVDRRLPSCVRNFPGTDVADVHNFQICHKVGNLKDPDNYYHSFISKDTVTSHIDIDRTNMNIAQHKTALQLWEMSCVESTEAVLLGSNMLVPTRTQKTFLNREKNV